MFACVLSLIDASGHGYGNAVKIKLSSAFYLFVFDVFLQSSLRKL